MPKNAQKKIHMFTQHNAAWRTDSPRVQLMTDIVLQVVFTQHSKFGDFWVVPCTAICW